MDLLLVAVQLIFKMCLALFAVVAVRYTLRWMDRSLTKINFETWLKGASDDAKARYYGYRLIAFCVLVGLALS
jgi:hypothetical protein